ncbi:MAG: polyprenyl synthetase family protein [Actinomycetota bacterium]|nr:polyprenyl synthetase family protein [Actinomycetota bacterium]
MSFSPSFAELRDAVEADLDVFLKERAAVVPEAEPLVSEIVRMLAAGGKRIRPLFCYWGFRVVSQDVPAIIRAASALELLHTFAIVHDDIMDAADERRGIPTVHRTRGTEVALLVGDLALVLADEALMSAPFPPGPLLRALEAYSRMRQEVIAGQFLDFSSATEAVSEERARRIAVLKSGNYSVEEPLLIGASLGGASDDVLEALARFGRPLGEAFQLRDDLLGTFGDPSVLGKPVDTDIRAGKRHVLYAKTLAALSGTDRRFFLDRWGAGASLTDDEIERLRDLAASGGRTATEKLLAELAAEARTALDDISCDASCKEALEQLVEVTVGRDA